MRDAQSPDVAKIMRGVSTCKMLGAVRSTLINLHGEKTPVSSDGGQAGANSFAANVLIIGKTGVGKSSFINYLYPDAKRTVSAGRPVTGKGIYKSVLELDNGLTVNLYDTWGLEANKADEWKAVIIEEVRRHDLLNIRDWFHTIIYCLSAKSARVEYFESKQINMLRAEGSRVLAVLTHCDLNNAASAADSMAEILRETCGLKPQEIVRVSSVSKTLLGGARREAFGKEAALNRIASNLWEFIAEKLPTTLRLFGAQRIERWYAESRFAIDDGIDFFNQFSSGAFAAVSKRINDSAKRCRADFGRHAEEVLSEAMGYYRSFLEKHESPAWENFHLALPALPRFQCDGEWQSTEERIIEIIAMTILPIAIPFMPDFKRDELKESLDSFNSLMIRWLDEYIAAVRRGLQPGSEGLHTGDGGKD